MNQTSRVRVYARVDKANPTLVHEHFAWEALKGCVMFDTNTISWHSHPSAWLHDGGRSTWRIRSKERKEVMGWRSLQQPRINKKGGEVSGSPAAELGGLTHCFETRNQVFIIKVFIFWFSKTSSTFSYNLWCDSSRFEKFCLFIGTNKCLRASDHRRI